MNKFINFSLALLGLTFSLHQKSEAEPSIGMPLESSMEIISKVEHFSPTEPNNMIIIGYNHNSYDGRYNAMHALNTLLKKGKIKKVAFEMPYDLQKDFDKYFASEQSPREMLKLLYVMVSRTKDGWTLNKNQKLSCAWSIMYTESLLCLVDTAWIAKKYGATVTLVDQKMSQIDPDNYNTIPRNKIMAKNLAPVVKKEPVIMLVGNAHIGHGKMGITLDDQLKRLGVNTLSICTDFETIPPSTEWGNEMGVADCHLINPIKAGYLLDYNFSKFLIAKN
jgi:hypothetical protein